jgi:hypothetical protein
MNRSRDRKDASTHEGRLFERAFGTRSPGSWKMFTALWFVQNDNLLRHSGFEQMRAAIPRRLAGVKARRRQFLCRPWFWM